MMSITRLSVPDGMKQKPSHPALPGEQVFHLFLAEGTGIHLLVPSMFLTENRMPPFKKPVPPFMNETI